MYKHFNVLLAKQYVVLIVFSRSSFRFAFSGFRPAVFPSDTSVDDTKGLRPGMS